MVHCIDWSGPVYCSFNFFHLARLLLIEELNFFEGNDFGEKLDSAYAHFIRYCKHHKIQHSQPPFLVKHVP